MADKYTAVWVSHSSMGDFLKCPRSYYLHNMYKDPKTGHKVSLVTPHMSLGIAVHQVLEGLAEFPSEERMDRDLLELFEMSWEKVSGKKGGFLSDEEEAEFKARGKTMIEKVMNDPRFLPNKCIKLPQDKMPCNFYLSEEHNIILNGLVDWIEYLPETDSLHIVHFKTAEH
ncbi:MAG: PD-(D/E)XK nuclease family protein, partial [Candidatus Pacebacteria bacterium]|nr:PD-(D/E)XK nuclease family protein [Candidatus Paceibacterota bacterium]